MAESSDLAAAKIGKNTFLYISSLAIFFFRMKKVDGLLAQNSKK